MMDGEALIPFLLIGGLLAYFVGVLLWKTWRWRSLLARARATGDDRERVRLLHQALLAANESPGVEGEILAQLDAVYRRHGMPFDASDYRHLMEQFQRLSGRGSGIAFQELVEVQRLKARLVEGFPHLQEGSPGGQKTGRPKGSGR